MKMPKENIDTKMFAPCGMNCKACYKHCYHKKPCAGCLNHDAGKPEHCRKCRIKDCISKKALSFCFECSEYPCKLVKNLEKSYNKRYQVSLVENCRYVQAYGLEHFMEQQKEKYICPQCGGIIFTSCLYFSFFFYTSNHRYPYCLLPGRCLMLILYG